MANIGDKPEHRKIMGILFIIISVVILYVIIFEAQNELYFGYLMVCGVFGSGFYILVTLNDYKRRYDHTKPFSTPITDDGLKLEDNSEELQKFIEDQFQKETPREIILRSVLLGMLIVGIAVVSILDKFEVGIFGFIMVYYYMLSTLEKLSLKTKRIVNKLNSVQGVVLICILPGLVYTMDFYGISLYKIITYSVIVFLFSSIMIFYSVISIRKSRNEENNNNFEKDKFASGQNKRDSEIEVIEENGDVEQ